MSSILEVDYLIMAFVQEHMHNAFTDKFFTIITHLGTAAVPWFLIALYYLAIKKRPRAGILILLSMGTAFLFANIIIKNIVQRTRPFEVYPELIELIISAPSSYSFPSSHTATSFAAATVIFYFSKKLGIASFVMAALIAFSRIFLFVHFPTDVLIGTILGIIIGALFIFLYKRYIEANADKGKSSIE